MYSGGERLVAKAMLEVLRNGGFVHISWRRGQEDLLLGWIQSVRERGVEHDSSDLSQAPDNLAYHLLR